MAPRLHIRVGMKKSTHKLSLRAQTIRLLSNNALGRAAGGNPHPAQNGFIVQDTVIVPNGFIMQDTVIVPTGRR
jgi:hypothetical protein